MEAPKINTELYETEDECFKKRYTTSMGGITISDFSTTELKKELRKRKKGNKNG